MSGRALTHDHPTAGEYSFEEDRHTATFVCTHVWSGGRPIREVAHDAGGDWQFLCGEGEHADASEAVLVCLEHVVSRDPSVNELASMCTAHVATRSAVGAPWRIEDETLANIREKIAEYGFWVGLVPAEGHEPAFAYTIGLYQSFQHPELLVFGLGTDAMHGILDVCGDLIRGGARFEDAQATSAILEGYDVRFRAVRDEASHAEYLGYGCRYYGNRTFPVLQCLWPDKAGRFAGEPGAAESLAKAQPLIP